MAFSCGIRCKMLLLCICLELPGKADGHDGCTGGGASVSERRWICVNVSKMEYLCVEHTHGSVLNVLLTAGSIEECLGSCPPDVLKDCKSSELPWIQKSYVGVVEGLVGFSSLWRDSVNPKMYEDGNIKSQVDENKNAKYVMAVCCGTSPADGLFVASSLNGAWSLMQYVQGLCVKERDISFCNAHGSVDVSKNYVIKMFFTSEGALVVCTTMGQLLLIDIETFQVVQEFASVGGFSVTSKASNHIDESGSARRAFNLLLYSAEDCVEFGAEWIASLLPVSPPYFEAHTGEFENGSTVGSQTPENISITSSAKGINFILPWSYLSSIVQSGDIMAESVAPVAHEIDLNESMAAFKRVGSRSKKIKSKKRKYSGPRGDSNQTVVTKSVDATKKPRADDSEDNGNGEENVAAILSEKLSSVINTFKSIESKISMKKVVRFQLLRILDNVGGAHLCDMGANLLCNDLTPPLSFFLEPAGGSGRSGNMQGGSFLNKQRLYVGSKFAMKRDEPIVIDSDMGRNLSAGVAKLVVPSSGVSASNMFDGTDCKKREGHGARNPISRRDALCVLEAAYFPSSAPTAGLFVFVYVVNTGSTPLHNVRLSAISMFGVDSETEECVRKTSCSAQCNELAAYSSCIISAFVPLDVLDVNLSYRNSRSVLAHFSVNLVWNVDCSRLWNVVPCQLLVGSVAVYSRDLQILCCARASPRPEGEIIRTGGIQTTSSKYIQRSQFGMNCTAMLNYWLQMHREMYINNNALNKSVTYYSILVRIPLLLSSCFALQSLRMSSNNMGEAKSKKSVASGLVKELQDSCGARMGDGVYFAAVKDVNVGALTFPRSHSAGCAILLGEASSCGIPASMVGYSRTHLLSVLKLFHCMKSPELKIYSSYRDQTRVHGARLTAAALARNAFSEHALFPSDSDHITSTNILGLQIRAAKLLFKEMKLISRAYFLQSMLMERRNTSPMGFSKGSTSSNFGNILAQSQSIKSQANAAASGLRLYTNDPKSDKIVINKYLQFSRNSSDAYEQEGVNIAVCLLDTRLETDAVLSSLFSL